MNRGDRREDIFVADHDRKSFVETLGATCDQTGWQVHAYCLMRVHGAIGPNDFGQERRESA